MVIFDDKIHLIIKKTKEVDFSESLCQGKLLLKTREKERFIRMEITDKAGGWQEAAALSVSDILFIVLNTQIICIASNYRAFCSVVQL